MTMWEHLGIEETKDLNRIKSSYAKSLRLHHPEEDPEGFQILKAAYDFAQKYANIKDGADTKKEELLLYIGFANYCRQNMRGTQPGSDPDEPAIDEISSDDDDARAPITHPSVPRTIPFAFNGNVSESDSKWIEDFLGKLNTLYGDFFARREAVNWEKLLKDDLFWNVDRKEEMEPVIQAYLSTHRNLPAIVWQILDDEYHWNDRIVELLKTSSAFAQIVLLETCRHWEISYSFITQESDFDFEKYLEFLRLTREAALKNNLKQMREYFNKAIAIYDKEPQIYIIVSEFLFARRENGYTDYREEYTLALDKLIDLKKDNPIYYQMRGDLNARCEDYDKAREDFLKAFELEPDNLMNLKTVVIYLQKQHMMDEAKRYMKHIQKMYPKTKIRLERQLSATADKDRLYGMLEENGRINEEVREILKFKFDPYKHGPILFVFGVILWVLFAILLRLS